MVPKYRQLFNKEFSWEKNNLVHQILERESGVQPLFRISESPIFLSKDFQTKLYDAAESIVSQVIDMSDQELKQAIPANCNVPGDTAKPHFFTIDFGICENENKEIVPQLIELQAFPSLYAYQRELENAYCEVYPFIQELKSKTQDTVYYEKLKKLIVGDENPENVILLEIFPEKQKTNIDFYFTEKKLGIKTVCLTKVKKEGRKLFYEKEGKKTEIKRIYNRVIFDELHHIPDLKTEFNFLEEADVKWITHPNWFFKVSKFLLPKLQHQYIPKSYFLNQFPAHENLSDFVLKPLFSFAGSGVNLNPTEADLQAIADKQNFIMQRKVHYAPVFEDINGNFSKGEIRLLYIWYENEARPQLVEHLARMTKAAMVNVDFNKKDAIWIGGTTAFFEN